METLELLDVVVLTEALLHTNLRKGELGRVAGANHCRGIGQRCFFSRIR
jgi:hypothetical protein